MKVFSMDERDKILSHIHRQYYWPLSHDQWEFVCEREEASQYDLFSNEDLEDFRCRVDEFLDAVHEFMGPSAPPRRKKRPAVRPKYSASFEKRSQIFAFVLSMKAEVGYRRFVDGESNARMPTWKELADTFNEQCKASLEGPAGPKPHALEMRYSTARREFHLSDEDEADLTIQRFLDTIDTFQTGKDHSACNEFRVIRRKRKGESPPWRDKIDAQDVHSMLTDIVLHSSLVYDESLATLPADQQSMCHEMILREWDDDQRYRDKEEQGRTYATPDEFLAAQPADIQAKHHGRILAQRDRQGRSDNQWVLDRYPEGLEKGLRRAQDEANARAAATQPLPPCNDGGRGLRAMKPIIDEVLEAMRQRDAQSAD